ncbi:MAG: AGE family epimerase/isomerase [Rhodobacteraceae bacterium]|nr:AGE family epimerase/isomerase [Paracoccaceae bacterium]
MTPDMIANWLEHKALPLWSGPGFDTTTGTVWEALKHLSAQAMTLFRFVLDKGFDPNTGNLAALLAPDTTILKAPHDLYDVAFTLLAASALIKVGHEIATDLAALETALARLKAPRGWYETAAGTRMRRQNSHMHMFEAAITLYATTGADRFKEMAELCLGLFKEVFLQPNGDVFEYFTQDWAPVADGQTVEPGHMMEWVYLLDAYEAATGDESGVDLGQIFLRAWETRDVTGTLPDRSLPMANTRRCWPQTELLKSAIVLERRGMTLAKDAKAKAVLAMLGREYLDTRVPGGWYDKRGADGTLLSDNMPASTFYHLLIALEMAERLCPAPKSRDSRARRPQNAEATCSQ